MEQNIQTEMIGVLILEEIKGMREDMKREIQAFKSEVKLELKTLQSQFQEYFQVSQTETEEKEITEYFDDEVYDFKGELHKNMLDNSDSHFSESDSYQRFNVEGENKNSGDSIFQNNLLSSDNVPVDVVVVKLDEEANFHCDICHIGFNEKAELEAHEKLHYNEDDLSSELTENKIASNFCSYCSKYFSSRSILASHVRIHTGEKPFRCAMCAKCFKRKDQLRAHVTSKHMNSIIRPKTALPKVGHEGDGDINIGDNIDFKKKDVPLLNPSKLSQLAAKKAPVADQLLAMSKRDKSTNLLKCYVCEKLFTQQNRLKRHLISHTNNKPHECEVCNKKFTLQFNLKTHMLTHTGIKPFTCSICDKSFYQKGNLTKHLVTHRAK